MNMKKHVRRLAAALVVVLLLIQLVPYGRRHANPPVAAEPSWNSPHTRELAARVCFDCHSNETRWPWYSHVAPVSWLVQRDVDEARDHLNFSEWNRPQRHARDAVEEYAAREMPPWFYLPLHAQARLGEGERATLLAGLATTFGDEKAGGRLGGEGEE